MRGVASAVRASRPPTKSSGSTTMQGSFEFHGSSNNLKDGFAWSYEMWFTRGNLNAVVFLSE